MDILFKRQARPIVAKQSRTVLLWILDEKLDGYENRKQANIIMALARQELVNRYICHDCLAATGQECLPEYGCLDGSRKPGRPGGPTWLEKQENF